MASGRRKVLATVAYLLDTTLVRVGNREYARDNKSYGLTTLQDRHVTFSGSELRFQFRGKTGKEWKLKLSDRRAARIVRSCQELPGQHLFQYEDDEDVVRQVSSADVNDYIRSIAGAEVTAKDFRTWAGTVLAAMALARVRAGRGRGRRQAQRSPRHRESGRAARQYASDLPQMLRASGGAGGIPRWKARRVAGRGA